MLGKAIQPEIEALIAARRFDELRALVDELEVADVADILEDLPPHDAAVVFRILPRELASDVFEDFSFDAQELVIRELSQETLGAIMNEMDPDDRTSLFEELPASVTRRLLQTLNPDELRVARTLLGYPEDSIGRLMTPEYFAARPDWTVEQTAGKIRETGGEVETVLYVYLVDERGKLIDDVHIARLVMAEPGTRMGDLIDESFVSLSPFDDREQAVVEFKKYDRFALPVVDRAGLLLGIVTVDDVLDVEEEEATEDAQMFGGQVAIEDSYFHATKLTLIRKRAGWLTILFAGGLLTAFVGMAFERFFEGADSKTLFASLVLFIPLVLSTGGNSGSQSASMIIRGLAIRELEMSDWRRVLRREFSVGLSMGLSLGVLLGAIQLAGMALGITTHLGLGFAAVAVISISSIVTLGALTGAMLPFFFKRLGFDPAVSSAPFIATVVDLVGIFIYFSLVIAFVTLPG